jgi:hypothetical protein
MLQRSKGREVAVVSRGRARRFATRCYSIAALSPRATTCLGHSVTPRRARLGHRPRSVQFSLQHSGGPRAAVRGSHALRADINRIMKAVRDKVLPETVGFFFGVSDGSETEEDLQIFSDALVWLKEDDKGVWRTITYQASW